MNRLAIIVLGFFLFLGIAIVMSLVGCIFPEQYATIRHGIEINKTKVPYALDLTRTRKHYDDMAEVIATKLIACNLNISKADFNGLRIIWSDAVAPSPSTGELNTVVMPGDGRLYNGFIDNKIIYIAWRGRVYRTALVHELIHYFLKLHNGNPDAEHKHKTAWQCEARVNEMLKRKNL